MTAKAHRRPIEASDEASTSTSLSSARPTQPAVHRLERLVHERIRLGILSALSAQPRLSFGDLKKLLETTDGNLSRHAQKLEQAGYITCRKSFRGRLPRTEFLMTPAGRQALENYLGHMEALIRQARAGQAD